MYDESCDSSYKTSHSSTLVAEIGLASVSILDVIGLNREATPNQYLRFLASELNKDLSSLKGV